MLYHLNLGVMVFCFYLKKKKIKLFATCVKDTNIIWLTLILSQSRYALLNFQLLSLCNVPN